jgi:hypothetical protein
VHHCQKKLIHGKHLVKKAGASFSGAKETCLLPREMIVLRYRSISLVSVEFGFRQLAR